MKGRRARAMFFGGLPLISLLRACLSHTKPCGQDSGCEDDVLPLILGYPENAFMGLRPTAKKQSPD